MARPGHESRLPGQRREQTASCGSDPNLLDAPRRETFGAIKNLQERARRLLDAIYSETYLNYVPAISFRLMRNIFFMYVIFLGCFFGDVRQIQEAEINTLAVKILYTCVRMSLRL